MVLKNSCEGGVKEGAALIILLSAGEMGGREFMDVYKKSKICHSGEAIAGKIG